MAALLRLVLSQKQNAVCTATDQTLLGGSRTPAHIHQKREAAMFQSLADQGHKARWPGPGQLDAQCLHLILWNLMKPVALSIRASSQRIMIYSAFAQSLRQAIEQ